MIEFVFKALPRWSFLLFVFILVFTSCKESKKEPRPIKAAEEKVVESYISFCPNTEKRLDAYFQHLSRKRRFNGVALFNEGDSLFRIKKGYSRIRSKDTFDFDQSFQLASLSKPITAFGLLHLLEASNISLETPVSDILTLFPDERITIYQLLTHTSGLGNYMYMTDDLWANPDSFITNREIQCYFEENLIPVYHVPGKRYNYCNSNYVLIASIIEQLTGREFAEYMQSEIFSPLGMSNTTFMNPKEKNCVDYPVLGHDAKETQLYTFYLNGVVGDKGLYSSVNDLFKFYKELSNPTLLGDSLLQKSMSQLVKSGYNTFYGLGWRSKNLGEEWLIYHNGWWRGFRTYFWFNQEKNKAVIVLTNSIRGGYLKQEEIWNLF